MGTVTYLLDTHALLWWWFVAPELSVRARALIADPQHRILVSAASIWEITTKFRNGNWLWSSRSSRILPAQCAKPDLASCR